MHAGYKPNTHNAPCCFAAGTNKWPRKGVDIRSITQMSNKNVHTVVNIEILRTQTVIWGKNVQIYANISVSPLWIIYFVIAHFSLHASNHLIIGTKKKEEKKRQRTSQLTSAINVSKCWNPVTPGVQCGEQRGWGGWGKWEGWGLGWSQESVSMFSNKVFN